MIYLGIVFLIMMPILFISKYSMKTKRRNTRQRKIEKNLPYTPDAKYTETLGLKSIHLTEAQKELVSKIQDNTITFVEAPAGTGKTLAALYYAVNNYLVNHDDIVVIRTPVEAGCVDKDTQFLSQNGWKSISDYVETDLVMEVDPKGLEGSFIKPLNYIKEPCSEFYKFKTSRGIDQLLTPEHNVAYSFNKKDKLNLKPLSELLVKNDTNLKGFEGKIATTFNYSGTSLNLSENELRLDVAIKADSTLRSDTFKNVIFKFRKKRKVKRLESILLNLNIEYSKVFYDASQEYCIRFNYPSASKDYKDWMFCSVEDAKILYSELKYWDGGISTHGQSSEHKFFTTSRDGADAVQYLGSILNFRTTICEDKREDKYTESFYTLTFTKQTNISLFPFQSKTNEKYIPELVKSEDGFKYCFTTNTGCFLARRGDKIFVTGNSDKIGFLPAGLEDKLEPHFASTKVILETLLSKGKVQTEMEKKIFFKIPNYCLGCTFSQSIVIIDEAQELSPLILKLLLERIGEYTKVIICGDPTQVYSHSTNRNGLTSAMKRFFETDTSNNLVRDADTHNLVPLYENICYHRFDISDVVRSEIVKTVLHAYTTNPL